MREWYKGPRNVKRRSKGLTQNSGLSCSFSTRRGNDYGLALYGINLAWARNRQVRLCDQCSAQPLHSTPLHSQKSASQHRIDSFVRAGVRRRE
jgi:hypothetical protein